MSERYISDTVWRRFHLVPGETFTLYEANLLFRARQLAEEINDGRNYEDDMDLMVSRYVGWICERHEVPWADAEKHFHEAFEKVTGQDPASYEEQMAPERDDEMEM
jgi:hypothetical protein